MLTIPIDQKEMLSALTARSQRCQPSLPISKRIGSVSQRTFGRRGKCFFVSTSSEVRRSSRSFSRSSQSLSRGGRITDRFPDARGEGFSDVNVEIVDEDADELIDFCDEHNLECQVF